jgi:hypothetical protein
MNRVDRHNTRHQPPPLPRRILGWIAVVAGVLMLILPGPGLIALAIGIILLGRRDPILRRYAILLRMLLRRLSHARRRDVRRIGLWLRMRHRDARGLVHEQVHRHQQGLPLPFAIKLWIGITLVMVIATISASLVLLLL